MDFYRQLLDKLEKAQLQVGNDGKQEEDKATNLLTNDDDYCLPCGGGLLTSDSLNRIGALTRILALTKKACVGNNLLDVRYMDIGLKGDDHTTCSICSETIATTDQQLILLPCIHIFHQGCIQDWLKSELGTQQWNCPTCRAVVPSNMETYCVQYDRQLQDRFNEYPISGFCTRCIISNMESLRNDSTGAVDADGDDILVGSVGQTLDQLMF